VHHINELHGGPDRTVHLRDPTDRGPRARGLARPPRWRSHPAADTAGYACPEHLPATASAMSPLRFREWMHFALRNVTADRATLRAVADSAGLLAGFELAFTVTVPLLTLFATHRG
jgi:hypothetical protein